MKKFIYKITNTLNSKVYIGQTVNLNERFSSHKRGDDENSPIHLAIKKYGVENFTFEVLDYCEDYNKKEIYYIDKFNAYTLGYNRTIGGEEPPIHKGLDNINTTHSLEQVKLVKQLLANTNLSLKEIAEKTNYDRSAIERINNGKIWKEEGQIYPIRKVGPNEERALKIIDALLNTNKSQKEIASDFGVSRTAITAINNGVNFKQDDLDYPLRKSRVKPVSTRVLIDS